MKELATLPSNTLWPQWESFEDKGQLGVSICSKISSRKIILWFDFHWVFGEEEFLISLSYYFEDLVNWGMLEFFPWGMRRKNSWGSPGNGVLRVLIANPSTTLQLRGNSMIIIGFPRNHNRENKKRPCNAL